MVFVYTPDLTFNAVVGNQINYTVIHIHITPLVVVLAFAIMLKLRWVIIWTCDCVVLICG